MAESTRRTQSASAKLRACLNCSVLKPATYFKTYGCPNCPFLQTNKHRNFENTTSASYKGVIGMLNPEMSWVAKWQRVSKYTPGLYAMTVEGELNEDYIEMIERSGNTYVNRTNSFELY
ncbi:transcription elongation factor SPT4 [Enteropsectra breve]|nr:transcription elongation factor SPT4 [Enteropsectra breve]